MPAVVRTRSRSHQPGAGEHRRGVGVQPTEARARFAASTVARLATVDLTTQPPTPHLVPLTFALLEDDTVVSAVDQKPKRTLALKRLANIAGDPRVALLADEYADDWGTLWWVRADGEARTVEPGQEPKLRARAISGLTGRYPQYALRPPDGPLLIVEVRRWSGWAAAS